MNHLFGFGHPIVSDLQVPGALARTDCDDARAVALEIVLRPEHRPGGDPLYCLDKDALLFSPAGVGQYRCHTDRIEVTPEPGFDPARLSDLLISTAIPAVQWMRGHFVLHATALVFTGRNNAIAICGISGSGKSTVAAQLIARGANLLADDSLRLSCDASIWHAAGLPGGYFLSTRGGTERRFVTVDAKRSATEAGIDAIFVLGSRAAHPSFRRLDGPQAVMQLLAMQHRPAFPALLGLRSGMVHLAAQVAGALPVYAWQRGSAGPELDSAEWAMLQGAATGKGDGNERGCLAP